MLNVIKTVNLLQKGTEWELSFDVCFDVLKLAYKLRRGKWLCES